MESAAAKRERIEELNKEIMELELKQNPDNYDRKVLARLDAELKALAK